MVAHRPLKRIVHVSFSETRIVFVRFPFSMDSAPYSRLYESVQTIVE